MNTEAIVKLTKNTLNSNFKTVSAISKEIEKLFLIAQLIPYPQSQLIYNKAVEMTKTLGEFLNDNLESLDTLKASTTDVEMC